MCRAVGVSLKKQKLTTQGNTFNASFENFTVFENLYVSVCVCGSPKTTGCYGPGMWNIKQKDNGMDLSIWSLCEYQ